MKTSVHVAIFALSVILFSLCMLWLPFERANPYNDITHRAMKGLIYLSGMGLVGESFNVMRIAEGRPADHGFTIEMAELWGFMFLILLLSESGLIASGF